MLLVVGDFGFEQGEDLFVDVGIGENPQESGEHGWHFVAAFGGNKDILDGGLAEGELDGESLAHDVQLDESFGGSGRVDGYFRSLVMRIVGSLNFSCAPFGLG